MIPYNVLIADDSITERKANSTILKSADFHIIGEAVNGEDTIEKTMSSWAVRYSLS